VLLGRLCCLNTSARAASVLSVGDGDTITATEGASVLLQAVVPPAAVGIAAARSDPGARRRTYSNKDIPTLTVMVTGRRVNL